MTQTKLSLWKIKTDSDTKKTRVWLPRRGCGEIGLSLELWVQSIIHRMDEKQGPTV